MPSEADGEVGKENAKVDDTDIQGAKAGKRNRADIEAGDIPPPAGAAKPSGDDPRKQPLAKQSTSRS